MCKRSPRRYLAWAACAVLLLGCSSDDDGGGGSLTGGSLTFDLDDVPMDFSLNSMALDAGSFVAVVGIPSLTEQFPAAQLWFDGTTGAFTNGAGASFVVAYHDSAGDMHAAMDGTAGTYSISVTRYDGVGGRTEGTFSGTLVDPSGGVTHVITNGHFDVPVMQM